MNIAELRRDYARASLDRGDVDPDPCVQLARWMHEAIAAQVPDPTAMSLATVTLSGAPSCRIVLLKGYDARGLVFYTNYRSRKGEELAANPRAACVLYWSELERQIRVEGAVEATSADESDAYFASRPLGSQISAVISPQSDVVADRKHLEELFAAAESRFGERVPRPSHWGGYRIVPTLFEYWQGRGSRLHDRIAYRWSDTRTWIIERLAP